MMAVDAYSSLVFDCDGVLLDSNRVKTEAFYKAALPYGEKSARALVEYHVANGGISRYKKFDFMLKDIVPSSTRGPGMDELLRRFAEEVRLGLGCCEIAGGLHALRKKTAKARWLVVSGGDQKELRSVFKERSLDSLFDGGIFGSPDTKNEILAREMASGNIRLPALFVGDSKYDHEVAVGAGLDFLFLSCWTEFHAWKLYCWEHAIPTMDKLMDLVGQA